MTDTAAPAQTSVERTRRYGELALEVESVLEGEPNRTARMATVVAMLAHAFPERFFWTGFYVVDAADPEELVVGPYQGTLGCLRIAFGRGVCGQSALLQQTLIVPDVEAFPGHIACDSRSRSEIVLPVFDPQHRLIAVLDIDSTDLEAFDETDADALETLLRGAFSEPGRT